MRCTTFLLAVAAFALGHTSGVSAEQVQPSRYLILARIAPLASFQRDAAVGAGFGWFLGIEATPRPPLAVGLEAGWYGLRSYRNETETYSIDAGEPSRIVALSATSRLTAPGRSGLFLCSEVGPAEVRWGAQRSYDPLNPNLGFWRVRPSSTDIALLTSIGAGIRRGWHRPYPRLEAGLHVVRLFGHGWNATGLACKTGLVF